jgi:O-methyltransferase involved in polyketide biosynthesis
MASDKITLTQEKETLFIPLYGKAQESRRPNPILVDRTAEAIIRRVDYDFTPLRVPAKTSVTLALRARKLDDCVRNFLSARRGALVLHLGCGLDSRIERLERPTVPWYDLDYPDVIALRRQFYPETATYHLLSSSVTDHAWMDQVAEPGPAIIIAEGLLMYLVPAEVKTLVQALKARFAGSELACDAFSGLTVRRIARHPSLQRTGAAIRWGIDDPREIESWAPGIRLLEEWFFSQSPAVAKLSPGFRLMFRLAALIPAAQRAHRVLRYQL